MLHCRIAIRILFYFQKFSQDLFKLFDIDGDAVLSKEKWIETIHTNIRYPMKYVITVLNLSFDSMIKCAYYVDTKYFYRKFLQFNTIFLKISFNKRLGLYKRCKLFFTETH